MRQARVAVVQSGDREAREHPPADGGRFASVCAEFRRLGIEAESAVYGDEWADDVRRQLERVSAALVWVNPLDAAGGRSVLDALLRKVAEGGVYVSAHPDAVLRIGTKAVLHDTRDMAWSAGEIRRYRTLEELRQGLALGLAGGGSRVLKQHRGNGGDGVWRITPADDGGQVRLLHARRGSREEEMPLATLLERLSPYLGEGGQLIDQPFVPPFPDGMVRCYLTHGRVVGFGRQQVTALVPPEPGGEPPAPPPRVYHGPQLAEFQSLRARMETEWVPELQRRVDLLPEALPVLWDADFLLRRDAAGRPQPVLCEINASCVWPCPDSAVPALAEATARRLGR